MRSTVLPGPVLGQVRFEPKPRTITMNEAKELVSAMLRTDDWTNLPGFVIADPSIMPEFPDFYMSDPYWDNPGRSVLVGHYAVERTTADVWSFPVCGRYRSPMLTKLQQACRNRIGMTSAVYEKLRKPGPSCAPGQVASDLKMGKPSLDALPKHPEK